MIQKGEVHSEREVKTGETSEISYKQIDHIRMQQMSSSVAISQRGGDLVQGKFTNATSIASSSSMNFNTEEHPRTFEQTINCPCGFSRTLHWWYQSWSW
ncbi:hypothetical protein Peur_047857 [Populus x canadensis]